MEPNSLTRRVGNALEVRTRELAEPGRLSPRRWSSRKRLRRFFSRNQHSPTDVQPVFRRSCETRSLSGGSLLRTCSVLMASCCISVASHNVGPSYVELMRAKYPMRARHFSGVRRVLLSRSVVRMETRWPIRTMTKIPPGHGLAANTGGADCLREGIALGVIVVGWARPDPFQRPGGTAEGIADAAVIAIENVRLFDEVQARTRELSESLERQTATSECFSVLSSSPGELSPCSTRCCRNAVRICGAKYGHVVSL